jgi:hypothetical protein
MPPGTICILGVWSYSAPINSEKSTTELNGPHFTEFGRLNLTLDLEIHQHLGSLKYVINIIMWIRDTECYRGEFFLFWWCLAMLILSTPPLLLLILSSSWTHGYELL